MPSPKYPTSAAPLVDIVPNQAAPTSSATSTFVVFNEDALTASDYPLAPALTIKGDDAQTTAVHVQAAPTGAAAVDLYLKYRGVTAPGSTAYVRVYGEIPLIGLPQIDSPHRVNAGYLDPTTNYPAQNQWIPLADEAGNYSIPLDNSVAMEVWDTDSVAASSQTGGICGSTTVFTRGTKRIMVLVEAATTDPDGVLVAGCFVY